LRGGAEPDNENQKRGEDNFFIGLLPRVSEKYDLKFPVGGRLFHAKLYFL
jgi:hypothetical protein